jgi:magnesium-transporting ATPase (P-type)
MKIKIILSSIAIAAFAFLAGTSLADCAVGAVCIDNPLQAEDLDALINSIINFIFWIGMALAPVMFIIAGFNFVTAAGDPKKVTTAKNIMIWTAVGLAVILLAKGLVAILNGIIGV